MHRAKISNNTLDSTKFVIFSTSSYIIIGLVDGNRIYTKQVTIQRNCFYWCQKLNGNKLNCIDCGYNETKLSRATYSEFDLETSPADPVIKFDFRLSEDVTINVSIITF
jgi:hypothetical protein